MVNHSDSQNIDNTYFRMSSTEISTKQAESLIATEPAARSGSCSSCCKERRSVRYPGTAACYAKDRKVPSPF